MVHFQGDFKQRFDLPLGCVEIFCTWYDRFLWITRFYTNSTCWAGISTVNNSVQRRTQTHNLNITASRYCSQWDFSIFIHFQSRATISIGSIVTIFKIKSSWRSISSPLIIIQIVTRNSLITSHVFQVKSVFFKLAASKLARLRVYQSGG